MNISESDIADTIANAAAVVMKNDREIYDRYFVFFEEYCISHSLTYTLLSAARALSPGAVATYDAYFISISSPRPEDTAREVANRILEIPHIAGLPKRVTLTKDESGWTIGINRRGCFKISQDMKYRGKSVDDIIGREKGVGLWTGKEVLCQNIYGVCSYLLSQYYDPMRIVPQDTCLELYEKIRPRVPRRIRGGGKSKPINLENIPGVYRVRKGTYLYDGDMTKLPVPKSHRVVAYSLHDYDDFALTKYIIHNEDDKPIAIFYDSLERQMVPIVADRQVSIAYVARSILLEVQMLRLMSHIGKDMTGMINNLLADLPQVIPEDPIGYVGAAVNWMILRREQGGFFGVFYPVGGSFSRKTGGVEIVDENAEIIGLDEWDIITTAAE